MNAQMKKGVLDICVLATINRGETYGYQILKDISCCLEISESTLYPILRRLEAAGYLISHSIAHEGRLRRMYQITEDGKNQLRHCLQEWEELMQVYYYIEESAGIDKN